jgi:hypothetical protein
MSNFMESVVTIAVAIVGLAILAVLVSNRANTQGIIAETGNAFTAALRAATGPVMGGYESGNISQFETFR